MLTYFRSLTDVGLYNIALPIMQIFNIFAALAFVITPMAAKLWENKEHEELAEIVLSVSKFMLLLLWFSFMIMIDDSESSITILFSSKFVAAKTCLIILCASIFHRSR